MVNIRKRGKVYQYQFEISKVDGIRNYQKVIKNSFRDATNYFGFLKYNPAVDLQIPKVLSTQKTI